MAYTRKRSAPARKMYRRRFVKRKPNYRKPSLYGGNRIVFMKRMPINGYVERFTGTGLNYENKMMFSLNQVASYTDITPLFKFYKITGVKYRFVYPVAQSQGNQLTPTILHRFSSDSTTSQSSSSILDDPSAKRLRLGVGVTESRWYFVRPKALAVGYEGVSNSFYSPVSPWIHTQDISVPYYGIDYGYYDVPSGYRVEMEAVFYLQFKGFK